MEPDIVSQVNKTCPSGQTDTNPKGESVMDVPGTDNNILALPGKVPRPDDSNYKNELRAYLHCSTKLKHIRLNLEIGAFLTSVRQYKTVDSQSLVFYTRTRN